MLDEKFIQVNHKSKLSPLPTVKRAKVRRKNEESIHQSAFFRWLSLWSPSIRNVTFHPANGGYRTKSEAKKLKAQGVTAGVLDICMLVPNDYFHGLLIEMKSKDGKLSTAQSDKLNKFKEMGYRCEVCYSWWEAREVVLDYLKDSKYA